MMDFDFVSSKPKLSLMDSSLKTNNLMSKNVAITTESRSYMGFSKAKSESVSTKFMLRS